MNIEGVNIEKGLARLGGRMKSYLKILGVFYKDSSQKLAELDEFYAAKNTPLYTTYIHGLKSALGNIGAEKLAKDSEGLEFAGNASDWNYIAAHHTEYTAEFKILLANIDSVLAGAATPGGPAVDKNKLVLALGNLRQSLDNMDFGGMKQASDALMEYEEAPGIGEKVKVILHSRLGGEYDAAIAGIDALLGEL